MHSSGWRWLACLLVGISGVNIPTCLLVALVYAVRFALCTRVADEAYLADTTFCWLIGAVPLCGPFLSVFAFTLRDE